MNVVGLKDTAQVRFVGLTLPQSLESSFLIAEGLQEAKRKLRSVNQVSSASAEMASSISTAFMLPQVGYRGLVRAIAVPNDSCERSYQLDGNQDRPKG